MNKKYVLSCLFSILFASTFECSSFQNAQEQAIDYAFKTALSTGVIYLGGKAIAKYLESTSPDAPPHFQKWARGILAKNGLKDAETVPLKMGNGWCVAAGSFIWVDSREVNALEDILIGRSTHSQEDQKRLCARVEYSLLHEKKHYHNGDFGKMVLLIGAVNGGVALLGTEGHPYLGPTGSMVAAVGLDIAAATSYLRYQEKEADRSAFMSISSLEKLEIIKRIREENAQTFETNLLKNPLFGERNWLGSQVRPMIADQWHTLNRDVSIASDEERMRIQLKQRSLIEIASFIEDFRHPSYRSTVELAQECLDKRKAINQKNFKSAVSAVLQARGIKQF